MEELMNIMQSIQEIQSEKLQVQNLDMVIQDKSDGVIVQMTSPDPDGKRMAEVFAKVFTAFPQMLKSQGVNINVLLLDECGEFKE